MEVVDASNNHLIYQGYRYIHEIQTNSRLQFGGLIFGGAQFLTAP